jgi:hypothetical protein
LAKTPTPPWTELDWTFCEAYQNKRGTPIHTLLTSQRSEIKDCSLFACRDTFGVVHCCSCINFGPIPAAFGMPIQPQFERLKSFKILYGKNA